MKYKKNLSSLLPPNNKSFFEKNTYFEPKNIKNGGLTWWRTTPVATKIQYHGAGGALLRARIYLLIFISLL